MDRVFDVVEAILNGKYTDEEIARECNLPSKRQGGYYRLAAKSLKLIEEAEVGWQPTLLGEIIANIDDHAQKVALMHAIILLNPFVRLIYHELEGVAKRGVSKEELTDITLNNTDLSRSTAERRVDTVLRWLDYLGLTQSRDSRVSLKGA